MYAIVCAYVESKVLMKGPTAFSLAAKRVFFFKTLNEDGKKKSTYS